MANLKEFRLTIDGVINGVEMTPETIPMARLMEYLTDLAAMMGYKESVHFMRVEPGSTQPVIYIEADEEARITARMQQAQKGNATKEANLAYKRFDARLREDQAIAYVANWEKQTNIIEFPGRNVPALQVYGPIRERASVVGEIKRVGGFDETVPIWLKRIDGEVFYCEADENIARQLGGFIYKTLRIHGIAKWMRNEEGNWILDNFRIQTFDPEPISDTTFTHTIEALRKIPDNGWSNVDDPLDVLQKIRHGEGNSAP